MKKIIFNPIIKLFSMLPVSVLQYLGGLIGLIMIKLSKRSFERLKNNLIITGQCSKDQVDNLAKRTAREAGKTIVETLCIAWSQPKTRVAQLFFEAKNLDLLLKATQEKSPIIFLTPHIGNFEMALKYTAFHIKNKFTILYKPSKDKWLNQLMLEGRTENNILPVPTNRQGIISLVKALRNNEVIGILPDNVASGSDGIWVNFFGQQVYATTLSAKMALTKNASVFLVASYRVKGGFHIEYLPFIVKTDNIQALVQEMYQEFEKMIIKNTSQYFWSYDRFRIPKYAKSASELI